MAARFVAAIDHGTTSTRCVLFAADGTPVAIAQRAQTMHYPRPGWVELDMDEVWQRTQECIHEVLSTAGATPADVAAIGLSNERETVVLWDRRTGRPVAPAITWQDTRTGRRRRRARRRRRHPPVPAPHRPADLDVLVRAQAQVAARPRPGHASCGRARRPAVRHAGHVAVVEPDRRCRRRRARDRSDEREPHAPDEPPHARVGRGTARPDGDPARAAARDPLVERGVRQRDRRPVRGAGRGRPRRPVGVPVRSHVLRAAVR